MSGDKEDRDGRECPDCHGGRTSVYNCMYCGTTSASDGLCSMCGKYMTYDSQRSVCVRCGGSGVIDKKR